MRRVLIATVVGSVAFLCGVMLFGAIVVRLFKATGNWDTEGAEIGLYPALIAAVAAAVSAWLIVRLVLRLSGKP